MDKELIRDYIRHVSEVTRTDYTGLARLAGLAPSTLTRFMNDRGNKYIPTTRTLAKVASASGVPFPPMGGTLLAETLTQTSQMTSEERINLLHSMARAIGMRATIIVMETATGSGQQLSSEDAQKWLAAIMRLPPATRDHVLELVLGIAESISAANTEPKPGNFQNPRRGRNRTA